MHILGQNCCDSNETSSFNIFDSESMNDVEDAIIFANQCNYSDSEVCHWSNLDSDFESSSHEELAPKFKKKKKKEKIAWLTFLMTKRPKFLRESRCS